MIIYKKNEMKKTILASLTISLVMTFSHSQNSSAQDEKGVTIRNDSVRSIPILNTDLGAVEPFNFLDMKLEVPNYESTQKEYLFAKLSKFNRVSYVQSLSQNDLGFGGFKHYNNTFSFTKENKYSFNMGIGLAIQNSIMNYTDPPYQYSLSTGMEYVLFKGISIYFYGQYLSSPLNKGEGYVDPFIYMNPFYLQTETGYGVKAVYKNIKADVGMKSIYDTQLKIAKPINSMNTKVSIGF